MRTFAVFLGGVFLVFVLTGVLTMLLDPNGGYWFTKAYSTPYGNPEILRHLQRSVLIAQYVVSPLVGVGVGIFVGLLQRNRALVVAALCLYPDFFYGLFTDHARRWTHSMLGVMFFVLHSSLPFATALLAAGLCRRFMNNHRRPTEHLQEQSAT